MPIVTIDMKDLKALMGNAGAKLDRDTFVSRVPMIGSDIESVEGDTVQVEFFPNRPDLYSVEGVARAMAAFLGLRPGLRLYDVSKPKTLLTIDESVMEVRPYMVAGVVKDITFNDAFIKSLMDVQEKLHASLGRNRKKVSIGLHDMDAVHQPFTYKAVDPESVTFVPLDMQEELDMREVLRKHPKGQEYGGIVADHPRWPLLVDRDGAVLSFPPIINGELTAVKDSTCNILIDVTGIDMNGCLHALNILCAIFADRGAKLEAVTVQYPGKIHVTPDMEPMKTDVKLDYINRWLGTELSSKQVMESLERMGHAAKPCDKDPLEMHVLSPAYRKDILHPVDIAEDVAIGFGYEKLEPMMPVARTTGHPRPVEAASHRYRKSLMGLGYLEVATLTLSNEDDEYRKMGAEPGPRSTIQNPLTVDYTMMRVSLIPSLLRTLKVNKHRDMPQRIFEAADVILGHHNIRHVAALSMHEKANFTEMKSLVQRVLEDMRLKYKFEQCEAPGFMKGRCAAILVEAKPDKGHHKKFEQVGHFGEIAPETITGFELEFPIAGFEMRVL
jgi:phenylalanyl-tRNA synthetase beta chain